MTQKTAVGYVRISTEDQSTFSIPYQTDQITEYCEKNDFRLLEVFTDEGQSAKNFDRKSWKKLEGFLQKNKGKVDVLVVFKYNRFSRNLKDALNVIHQLEEVWGITLLSVSEPLPLAPDNPFFFQFRVNMLLQAHSEWLMIRENTINGQRKAKSLGCYMGKAPFGYRNHRTEGRLSTLKIEEKEAAIIRNIFKRYLAGEDRKTNLAKAQKEGLNRTGNSVIRRVLTNPVYVGRINKNVGEEKRVYIKGLHEPIIDPETFDDIQVRLRSPGQENLQANEKAWLKRMISCPDCMRIMTCSRSHGRSAFYWYYECSTHRKSYPIEKAHTAFEEVLGELDFDRSQIGYLKEKIKENLKELLAEDRVNLPGLRKQLTEISQKLNTVNDKYFSGIIDDATYLKYTTQYKSEIKGLKSRINRTESAGRQTWKNLFADFDGLLDIRKTFVTADIRAKQEFIRLGFGNALVWDGNTYRTGYMNPVFVGKALLLKQKGLMEYQPLNEFGTEVPVGVPTDLITEPIAELLTWIEKNQSA